MPNFSSHIVNWSKSLNNSWPSQVTLAGLSLYVSNSFIYHLLTPYCIPCCSCSKCFRSAPVPKPSPPPSPRSTHLIEPFFSSSLNLRKKDSLTNSFPSLFLFFTASNNHTRGKKENKKFLIYRILFLWLQLFGKH